MDKKKQIIQRLVKNAIVLSLYVVFTFVTFPAAFINVQFRLSEMLVLLCFFNRDYVIAITLGCFFCNLASPMMPWDLLIGTSATLFSCLITSFARHLGIAAILTILINSFVVGAEYFWILNHPFWFAVAEVSFGETIMVAVGYIIAMLVMKNEGPQKLIDTKRNADFKW